MLHCDKFLLDLFAEHGQIHDPNASIITLSGKDAVAFAQAQFMNDVALLHDGDWQFNGWLSAKGKVQGFFLLQRVDASTLRLVLWDVAPQTFIDALMRFRFRAKVLAEIASLTVTWSAQPITDALACHAVRPNVHLCLFDAHDNDMPAPLGMAACMLLHIPRQPNHDEDFPLQAYTPQMLGLARLSAYSTKKGCYPGQEIVARTHFLGKNKRSLVLLKLDGVHDIAPQTDVHARQDDATKTIGHTLSVTTALGDTWIQAVVTVDSEQSQQADMQNAAIQDGVVVVR